MKKNIFMIMILITLFFFGLLIYDFSDELDKTITEYNWYKLEEEKVKVISFKDREISYYFENDQEDKFDSCTNYKFNKSVNVLKVNCLGKENKIYLSNIKDTEVTLSIEGNEETFYITKELAEEAKFIEANNLEATEFAELMNIDLNKFKIISASKVSELYKEKDTKIIAFVNKEASLTNALNIKALENLAENCDKELLIVDIDEVSDVDLKKLNRLNSEIPQKSEKLNNDEIPLYTVGSKKIKCIDTIKVNTYSEINNYNDI